ncbi:MAG TPA: YdcF family protein [Verrucomicrobiae bacterium]|jgi:uncharacterized SAM-binding protein YcdF (DUF218 family)|nr:YdcF family protein [Verrucomicrobiae bacterium]
MSRRKRIFRTRRRFDGPRRRGRWLMRVGVPLFAAAIAWLLGLVLFAETIPTHPSDDRTEADAIVVLTGGSDRLKEGLQLLAKGEGKQLLISGVHANTDIPALLQTANLAADLQPSTAAIACCITVGYEAGDTTGNALESARWMAERDLHSLRLVTADYHMPRSLLEFHAAMPDVKILPHPVFPETVKRDQWYLWPGTTSLIIREYHKFLLATLRIRLGGLFNRSN